VQQIINNKSQTNTAVTIANNSKLNLTKANKIRLESNNTSPRSPDPASNTAGVPKSKKY
jgi:hypothetical protein